MSSQGIRLSTSKKGDTSHELVTRLDRLPVDNINNDIARGNVQGARAFSSFGSASVQGAGSKTIVSSNATFPDPFISGVQFSFRSTSGNDFDNGSIGIRSIEIHYLDNELAEQTEIISLTGASLVNSVATDIRFINDMHVYTFGSGSAGIVKGHAQGNITAEYQGTVYAKIGINQRLQKSSARMVPKGKKLFVADTTVGSTSGSADARCTFTLVANKYNSKLFDNPFLFMPINAMSTQDNSVLFTLPVPLEFPEGTVVAFEFSRDKTCTVEAAFHGWIEDV
tara:strand:- start:20289 stop:21131 length:843 start_codon:yes stop_codon:yes gene_type:complete